MGTLTDQSSHGESDRKREKSKHYPLLPSNAPEHNIEIQPYLAMFHNVASLRKSVKNIWLEKHFLLTFV